MTEHDEGRAAVRHASQDQRLMLHIKDIEAFARINEALARNIGGAPRAGLRPASTTAIAQGGLPANDAALPLSAQVEPAEPANDDRFGGRRFAPAPAEAAEPTEASDEDDTVASVDAIPLSCAEVLAFPVRHRDREAHDAGADSVGGMAYDFDLVPHRPATMVGMLSRMFFGRR